jgi:hypothetical protein
MKFWLAGCLGLAARPEVDAKRLAYVGHSYGAQWGAILSAVDGRPRTAVLVGGIPDQAAIHRDGQDPAVVELRASLPPGRLDRDLAVRDRTAAVRYVPHAKVPRFIQFARYGRYFDQAAMDRYAAAATGAKEVKWYDTGHDLNDPQALLDRAAWLHRHIGLGPVRLGPTPNP